MMHHRWIWMIFWLIVIVFGRVEDGLSDVPSL